MNYPFKYPEVYAELARQGLSKKSLANHLKITTNGLRYKQTTGDFDGDEMKATAEFLKKPATVLFGMEDEAS